MGEQGGGPDRDRAGEEHRKNGEAEPQPDGVPYGGEDQQPEGVEEERVTREERRQT